MMNKQKVWFLTLFSLILMLSVYYITMPNEILASANTTNKKTTTIKANTKVNSKSSDYITALQVEKDEERSALAAEYNEVLTNNSSTTEEKNNAYEGLKQIDEIKAKEESLKKKIKKKMKLDSFIKIENDNINVVIKKDEHDYSLANEVMRLIQEEYNEKVYVSVKFKK